MTDTLKNTIEAKVIEYLAQDANMNNAKLKLLLRVDFFESKGSEKLITEVLKNKGLIITKSEGRRFNLYYYNEFLVGDIRTKDEFELLMSHKSLYGQVPKNVITKRSSYLRSFELSQKIHSYRDMIEAEKNPLTEQEQKIKDAYRILQEGKAKKAKGESLNKGMYHPDKVFSLRDEKLTKAYTAFFQSLNK